MTNNTVSRWELGLVQPDGEGRRGLLPLAGAPERGARGAAGTRAARGPRVRAQSARGAAPATGRPRPTTTEDSSVNPTHSATFLVDGNGEIAVNPTQLAPLGRPSTRALANGARQQAARRRSPSSSARAARPPASARASSASWSAWSRTRVSLWESGRCVPPPSAPCSWPRPSRRGQAQHRPLGRRGGPDNWSTPAATAPATGPTPRTSSTGPWPSWSGHARRARPGRGARAPRARPRRPGRRRARGARARAGLVGRVSSRTTARWARPGWAGSPSRKRPSCSGRSPSTSRTS